MEPPLITISPTKSVSREEARWIRKAAQEEYTRQKAKQQQLGREKAAATVTKKKAEGLACSVIIPIGYKREYSIPSREPVIDLEMAPLAQEAFELALKGQSLRQILSILTPKGLVSRNGTPMYASSLRAMLTNPFYAGLIRVSGELIQGKHEKLISRKELEQVKQNLQRRRKQGDYLPKMSRLSS